MRHGQSFLLLAFGSSAAAWTRFSQAEESWSPPRETSPAENEVQFAQGWSPRPTDAPRALFGRMELLPRADDYTLAPGTCGFISSNEVPYVCIETRATCTLTGNHVGCCIPNVNCNVVKTTCIDYDAAETGACDLPDDFSTLCCKSSTRGACYTYLFSTAEGDDESDLSTYSFLDCSARGGTGTLLSYDPTWSRTRIPSSSTEESDSSTTDGSESETETGDNDEETASGSEDDGGSSTNVGAIAGGTVGGVAVLALIGAGLFIYLRKQKKSKDASVGGSPAQPNPTDPSSPPMSQTPASAATYPSGVPSGVPSPIGYNPAYPPQEGYNPHMSTYSQQGYPPQQGYQPFPPQGQYPAQYPAQQGLHPQYGYQPSSTASPPPHTTPSPPVGGYSPHVQQPQQPPATELAAVNPVGSQNNRAELS